MLTSFGRIPLSGAAGGCFQLDKSSIAIIGTAETAALNKKSTYVGHAFTVNEMDDKMGKIVDE